MINIFPAGVQYALLVGTCENDFAAPARADGIQFTLASAPWLTGRGRLDLPEEASGAIESLRSIFTVLDGDLRALAAKSRRLLSGDLFHIDNGTFVELDERQHFTAFRLVTLALYPADVRLGFDPVVYRALCGEWRQRADRDYRHKSVLEFPGQLGRQRQRAYIDAVRDLPRTSNRRGACYGLVALLLLDLAGGRTRSTLVVWVSRVIVVC